ncbi:hypothetical protein PANT_18d00014 [Moesziomyces antarcticus T-34]|uniref:Uncharacterized protein n=1 Tax=Pseudozyma antarctica (strain T-34) TaxID=1151754 RepID=M9LYA0_PSEA3|nr:hypothetical protein PANT_18d00014 [Moesziomyces antarcticus T-34]
MACISPGDARPARVPLVDLQPIAIAACNPNSTGLHSHQHPQPPLPLSPAGAAKTHIQRPAAGLSSAKHPDAPHRRVSILLVRCLGAVLPPSSLPRPRTAPFRPPRDNVDDTHPALVLIRSNSEPQLLYPLPDRRDNISARRPVARPTRCSRSDRPAKLGILSHRLPSNHTPARITAHRHRLAPHRSHRPLYASSPATFIARDALMPPTRPL